MPRYAVLKATSQSHGRVAAGERHGMCDLASAVQRWYVGENAESGRVAAGERHGICELAFNDGRGTAMERDGMCESALILLFVTNSNFKC
jgi:hypothetical protein